MRLPEGFVDTGLFITRDEVPVYDEGAPLEIVLDADGKPKLGADGRPELKLATVADLKVIADTCNRRVKETGDETPIVIGHTRKGAPENEQPEVVGFARNYRVALWRGKNVITATFRFLKDKFEEAMKHPRRSVEIWKDRRFDPIALLGATTPERDLGLLYCSKEGDCIQLEAPYGGYGAYGGKDGNKVLVQEVISAIQETDTWKAMEAKAKAPMPGPSGTNTAVPGLVDAGKGTENEMYDCGPMKMNKCPACGHQWDMEAVQNAKGDKADAESADKAAPKPPAGPVKEAAPGKELDPDKLEKKRMENESDKIKLSKLEADLAATQTALAEVTKKYLSSEHERKLIQLEAEGFPINRVDEMEYTKDFNDTQFDAYLVQLRKHTAKGPANQKLLDTRGEALKPGDHGKEGTDTNKVSLNKDVQLRLARYATDKNITFAQALKELEAGAVPGLTK